ncbi:hypothetical protein NDU88_003749 [Pleurodeles waltl]|uniref:Uncharacterized protein n=1 Tax=Pleurodeles waltl TaxID=8319 RepID=A0AAV7QGA8_PLEWA|nr:hypothetical protein NDU88_003749 [Pleurodeles waltl]
MPGPPRHRSSALSRGPSPAAARLKAPPAPLRSQRSNSPPGALLQQAPAAGPLQHFSRMPHRARACLSPGPGRPRIHSSVPAAWAPPATDPLYATR